MNKNHQPSDFWIYFHGRSGSSWLKSLLSCFDDIDCASEIFQGAFYDDSSAQMDAIEKYYAAPRSGYVLSRGCKTKGSDVLDGDAFAEFVTRSKLSLILLRRRNVVKQAVSLVRGQALFERDGEWNLRNNRPPLPPVTVDPGQVLELAEMFDDANDQLAEHVESITDHVYTVWYEELLADPNKHVAEIRAFLNLPVLYRPEGEVTSKNSSDNLRSSVENFDELELFLSSTRFSCFLSESV